MSERGLHPIETASRDEIAALQLSRLRATLLHAYAHVPHYRAAFESAGVHPDDLKDLADLARFPFTTKADLRAGYPFGMFAVPRERVARIHASSGTTGQATVVGYTREDLDTWAQCVARSLHAAGARSGDRVHVSYGYGLFTGGLGLHAGAEALGCAVIPFGGGQTGRQVQLIADFRPDVLCITPSYALALADAFHAHGLDPAASGLRVGVFGAEPWTDAMRREIEATFALDATDIYGLSEVMGPGVAQECAATKDGLHVWEDHFLPEIVDPATGAPLPDGEQGELVFTTLTRQASPVVRYRTRDLARLLPGTARSMRRLGRIAGRTDDMLIVRGVNLFPSQIEELVLAQDGLAGHFHIELTRTGRLDEMTLRVECRPDRIGAPLGPPLAAAVKARAGLTCTVEVVPPGTIERSTGKARRVTDRRGEVGSTTNARLK